MRLLPVSLVATGLLFAACRQPAKPAAAPATPPRTAAPIIPASVPPTGGGDTQPGGGGAGNGRGGGGGGGAGAQQGGAADPVPRPYNTVITNRSITKRGVFGVHQVASRLYFEIPKSELGRDFVIVTTLNSTPDEIGIRGTQGGNNLVRFERRENRIFLREASYSEFNSDTTAAGRRAFDLINLTKILAAFNIEAYGPDSSSVIEVTRLFTGGVPEYTALGARAQVDATRSYVDHWAAFPRNVNVTAVQSFTPQAAPGAAAGGGRGAGGGGGNNATTEKYSFSIAKLPDVPMRPRLMDERVGYFGVTQRDFSGTTQRVEPRRLISRWRLECGDQKVGNLCVPKKPITYYLDPATPAWIKPWIKKGIESWQVAFEEAGFSKGIIAADAPNDPDFSGEDATVSMVRWLPSATENAVGPSLKDPRTGEIIDADVQTYLNVMNLARSWYFTQVGPLDKRAQKFPFPDSLMGRLIQYVTAHEVGHTLGFPHNFKASSMYPFDSVRSKTFVAKMGHSPSLMDYARFNYVAQPEDGIALDDLIPKVGPYDKYAVMWGYTPIPGANTPEAEKPTLDKWSKMQDTIPWYRFASDNGANGADPAEQSEAVGDADAVRATTMGIRNLKRVMSMMESATAWKDGTTFADLSEIYGRTVGQWANEMGHVARIVGAEYKQEKLVGQTGPVYRPVEVARQRTAVQFLNDNAFATPTWLLDDKILSKIEASGSLNRVGNAQARAMTSLLSNERLDRMIEMEAFAKDKSKMYQVSDLLSDLRNGLWKELATGASIDPFRRRLQREYLDAMDAKINPPVVTAAAAPAGGGGRGGRGGGAGAGDFRAIVKSEMRVLDAQLVAAIPKTHDRMTKAHLEDARDQIKGMLDPLK